MTDEDRHLLRLVATGLDRGSTALALGCTRRAVGRRMRDIRRSLEARTDIHAVVVALRRGVIE